jgi:hypothetical protein
LIKFIKRLILLSLLLGGGFLVVSIQDGGGAFRRFGDTVKGGAEEVATNADMIKESTDGVRKAAGEAVESIKRTVEMLRETANRFAALFGEEGKEEESGPEETSSRERGAVFSASAPATSQAAFEKGAAVRDD